MIIILFLKTKIKVEKPTTKNENNIEALICLFFFHFSLTENLLIVYRGGELKTLLAGLHGVYFILAEEVLFGYGVIIQARHIEGQGGLADWKSFRYRLWDISLAGQTWGLRRSHGSSQKHPWLCHCRLSIPWHFCNSPL